MRLTIVSPSAARPAMTSETEARRSVAITGAPRRRLTPLTTAVSPSSLICAPKRASSCTCMKRFSKMVSLMRETPFARASIVAAHCRAGLGERVERLLQQILAHALEHNVAAGHGHGGRVGSRFDAVGQDTVIRAIERGGGVNL